MIEIVAVRSKTIEQQLQCMEFRRLNLRLRVADTASDVKRLVTERRPRAVVIETGSDPAPVFAVCRDLKSQPESSDLPVVLVANGAVTPEMQRQMMHCRCDRLLAGSLGRGKLYEALEPYLLGRVQAHPRIRMDGTVIVIDQEREEVGSVFDLSLGGVRLSLPVGPEVGASLTVRLLPDSADAVEVPARVVWAAPSGECCDVALQFTDILPEAQELLEQMTTWSLSESDGKCRVKVMRELTEHSNWNGLTERLKGRVEIDLSKVATINSQGITGWVEFLRGLPPELDYAFVACSSTFSSQASYLPDMVGRARILSVYAPYYCKPCDHDAERELLVAELGDGGSINIPDLICPRCSKPMLLDEDPDRFYSFIQSIRDEK